MAMKMADEKLTGLQKSAILLIALGPERSATIFKHLKEDEIEELTLEIANTRSVTPQVKEAVIEEFYGTEVMPTSYAINRILAVAPFVVLQAYYPPSENDEIPGIAGTCCHNAIREWVLSTILYDAPTVTKDGKTYTVPTMKMSAEDIKALAGHFFYQFRYVYDSNGNIVYDEDGIPEENTEFTETIRCDDDTFILQK